MNKKLLCLALALVMVCVASVAFAAGSKSTSNMTTSTTTSAAEVVVAPAAQNAVTTAALAEIQAVVDGGKSVVEYFDDATQAAIASLLPAGTDAKGLVLNELFPLTISNADSATGSVSVSFQCATAYSDGQAVVAMLGVSNGGTVTWTPLSASVVGGKVVVSFTQAQLQAIASGNAFLGILS